MNTIANSDSWCLGFKLPSALAVEYVIRNCLEGSRWIGHAKGRNPELVMTKRSPERSLRFILIPKQDLMEPRQTDLLFQAEDSDS